MKTLLTIVMFLGCAAIGVGAAVLIAGRFEEVIESRWNATSHGHAEESPPVLEARSPSDRDLSQSTPAVIQPPLPSEVVESTLQSSARTIEREVGPTGAENIASSVDMAEEEPKRLKAQFTAAPSMSSSGAAASQTSPNVDISQIVKALQSGDPTAQQQLQSLGGQMSGNAAMAKQLLNVPGLENILGNSQAIDALKALADQSQTQMPMQGPALTQGPALPLPRPMPREELPAPAAPKHTIKHSVGPEGDDQLTITMQDEDIRGVLEMLSEQGDLNILASDNVQGKVSAVLKNVDVYQALDAILKSTGYVMQREGKFIYVGTPKDFANLRTSLDHIGTRVYRPNYVTAKELQVLLTPLLTSGVGRISVTAPAAVGIAIDTNSSGGDSPSHGEGVLVQDYEAVLSQIDDVVREIDRRPMQVHIEAMIISVTLNDTTAIGVNFQFLRNEQNVRFGTGTPRVNPLNGAGTIDPTTGGVVGEYQFTNGGLQFAFLDQSLGMFLTMLETVGDINVLATPRLLCLNKQRAEILIGEQIPYTTSTVTQTFTTQTVQFLDIGTQLRLRPYISSDGTIRMEIHPEISSAGPTFNNVPSKILTQVTTNVMCYDGCTIVIGGLMEEDLNTTISQVPYLGSVPVLGPLFRTKTDTIVRREILVLLTPRIVYEPEYDQNSEQWKEEFERRQLVSADSQSLLSRTTTARRMIRKAEEARAQGDITRARRFATLAVRFDPNNRMAMALRDELNSQQLGIGKETHLNRWQLSDPTPGSPMADPGQALDGNTIDPSLLDDLQGVPMMPMPVHPIRPGVPGDIRDIPTPETFPSDVIIREKIQESIVHEQI